MKIYRLLMSLSNSTEFFVCFGFRLGFEFVLNLKMFAAGCLGDGIFEFHRDVVVSDVNRL